MKGSKTDLSTRQCGIARSLGVIGDWWSLMIVRDALKGFKRFGEFQKSVGLAKNILSTRLKKLVDHGILVTEPESEGSAYNAYVLTPKGEQLGTVLMALWQWGEEHCFLEDDLEWMMVDREQGQPIKKIELRTADGRTIGPADFTATPRSSVAGAKKTRRRAG